MRFMSFVAVCGLGMGVLASNCSAGIIHVRVTAENLAKPNGIAFAPLRVGFNSGNFDAFDNGTAATAPIISIAEGGSGSDWFPAFSLADPTATLGTVISSPPGPLLPGNVASAVFAVDNQLNRYFTFAAMVVPSNDNFIGNDSPTKFELFDAAGNLLINTITQFGRDIWDAGSETTVKENAAFLVGGINDNRVDENGVVTFDFSGLTDFDGLQTAAGYFLDSQLTRGSEVYRISFTVVPEPSSLVLVILGGLGLAAVAIRRRLAKNWIASCSLNRC